MADRMVVLDDFTMVDPQQVDGLSYRRGSVTVHLRSGRALSVWKGAEDALAADALHEVRRALWPNPDDLDP